MHGTLRRFLKVISSHVRYPSDDQVLVVFSSRPLSCFGFLLNKTADSAAACCSSTSKSNSSINLRFARLLHSSNHENSLSSPDFLLLERCNNNLLFSRHFEFPAKHLIVTIVRLIVRPVFILRHIICQTNDPSGRMIHL